MNKTEFRNSTLPSVSSCTLLVTRECDGWVCTQSEIFCTHQCIVSLNYIKAVNTCKNAAKKRHMPRMEVKGDIIFQICKAGDTAKCFKEPVAQQERKRKRKSE